MKTSSQLTPPPEHAPEAHEIKHWHGHMAVAGDATSGFGARASLIASSLRLELAGPLGTFQFVPAQVKRLKRGRFLPWFWGGLRISHRVDAYPKEIAFFPVGDRSSEIMRVLRSFGFGNG